PARRGVTCPTIHRTISTRLERHLSRLAALFASNFGHLPPRPLIVDVAAEFLLSRHASRRGPRCRCTPRRHLGHSADTPTLRASLRCMLQALGQVKLLLTHRKDEGRATFLA